MMDAELLFIAMMLIGCQMSAARCSLLMTSAANDVAANDGG